MNDAELAGISFEPVVADLTDFINEKLATLVSSNGGTTVIPYPVRTGRVRKYDRHVRFAATDRSHSHGWVGYHAKRLAIRRKVR